MATPINPTGPQLPTVATPEDQARVLELNRAMNAANRLFLTASEVEAAGDRLEAARAASEAAVALYTARTTDL